MRNKPSVIALILIIATAWISTGFSLAADIAQTNGNNDIWYEVAITDYSISDNELTIDVGVTSAVLIDIFILSFSKTISSLSTNRLKSYFLSNISLKYISIKLILIPILLNCQPKYKRKHSFIEYILLYPVPTFLFWNTF